MAAAPTLRVTTIVWLGAAGCDGCTMAMLGAVDVPIEKVLLGAVPDLPPIRMIHPALALESGATYMEHLRAAARGELSPLILVLEGSVMDEQRAGPGTFSRLGPDEDGRAVTTADWVRRLASQADAVVAIGSCAAWGGVPAAQGNVTGAMGLQHFLGMGFRSRAGHPVINVPGCAPAGDAFVDALSYTVLALHGVVPLELDEEHRPRWLYAETTPVSPPRSRVPAHDDDPSPPLVGCHVPERGWMGGIGGCARVGGACIGCTAPDFTDRLLPLARPRRAPR